MNKNKLYWRLTAGTALVLVLLSLSPLVLYPGKINPKFLSMPFTLWVSILITILLVVLTYVGGRILLRD